VEEDDKGVKDEGRRRFLKTATGVGLAAGGAYLGWDASRAEASPGEREHREPGVENVEVLVDEILRDPVGCLDQACETLVALAGDDLTEYDREFLDKFSEKYSETPEVAERNRAVLDRAYVQEGYGERALNIMERSMALTYGEPTKWERIYGDYIGMHSKFTAIDPMHLNFYALVNNMENVRYLGISEKTRELEHLVEWFEPLMEDDPDGIYQERAWEAAGGGSAEEAIEEVYNLLRKLEVDPELMETYEDLRAIMDVQAEVFPLAGAGLRNIVVSEDVRPGHDWRKDVVWLADSLSLYQEDPTEWNLNWTEITLLHEESHGYDVQAGCKERLWNLHPADFMEYNEAHLEALEMFDRAVRQFTPAEIEEFCLDPGMRMKFGEDIIRSRDSLEQFEKEVGWMEEVARWARTPEGKSMVRETGMEAFFDSDEELLITSLISAENLEESLELMDASSARGMNVLYTHQSGTPGGFEGIRKFSSQVEGKWQVNNITPEHLAEMREMARQAFELYQRGGSAGSTKILDALVEMKSAYMLANYAFLQRANLVEEFAWEDPMCHQYNLIAIMTADSVLHLMNGPVGEYMYFGEEGWNLDDDPQGQVERVLGEIKEKRQKGREAAEKAGRRGYYSGAQAGLVNDLYRKVAEIQKIRAKMWGAEDPDTAYREFAQRVREVV